MSVDRTVLIWYSSLRSDVSAGLTNDYVYEPTLVSLRMTPHLL